MSEVTRRLFLGSAGAAALGACASSTGGGAPRRAAGAPELADLTDETGPLPPFPAGAHAERRERLYAALRRAGAGAICLGPTVNLRYFTGAAWGASERLFGCVLFPDRPPVWISPAFEELRAREVTSDLGELRTWHEWEDPHALVAEVVRAWAGGRPLAVDPHLRATHAVRLASALGAGGVADALPIVAEVRARKEPAELARMRRASELTKRALDVVKRRVLKPGVEEPAVAGAMVEAQERLGLANAWCIALFGPNAAFPHGTRHRRPLQRGEMALLDTGGELEGYQSDVTRTYASEAASDHQRTVYALVRSAQKAAAAAARPGVACEEVDAAARAVVAGGGFGPDHRYFTHRLGHGIGMEGHEDPYFCRGNRTVLAPGMTLSNEPGIYVPGELGVRIEDVVVVTRDGVETLGPPPADELETV